MQCRSEVSQPSKKTVHVFFFTLWLPGQFFWIHCFSYISLPKIFLIQSRGSRAVFQFYPENSSQVELITSQAMKAGFTGGLVVDYPNSTKAKKFFLCLMTGGQQPLPTALGVDSREDAPNCVTFSQKRYVFFFPWQSMQSILHSTLSGSEIG